MHTHIDTHTRIYIYVYTHTHTHTYIYIPSVSFCSWQGTMISPKYYTADFRALTQQEYLIRNHRR